MTSLLVCALTCIHRQSYRLDSTVGRALMHAETFLSACLPPPSTTSNTAHQNNVASSSDSPLPNANKTPSPFSPNGTVNELQNPASSEVQAGAAGATAAPTAAVMVDSTTCARHKVLSSARKATLDVATNTVVKHLEANFKVRVLAVTLDFALDRRGRLTLLWVGDATVASGTSGVDLSLAGLRPDRSSVRDSWLLNWTAKQALEAKEKEAAAQCAANSPNPAWSKNNNARATTARPSSDDHTTATIYLHHQRQQSWVREGSKEARAAVAAAAEVVEALRVDEAAELLGYKSNGPRNCSQTGTSSSSSSFATARATHHIPGQSVPAELPLESSATASYFEPIHRPSPVLKPVHAHKVGKNAAATLSAALNGESDTLNEPILSNEAQPSPSSSSSSSFRMPQSPTRPSTVVPTPRVHYGGGHLGGAAATSDASNGQQKLFCSPRRFGESGDEGRVSMGGSDAQEHTTDSVNITGDQAVASSDSCVQSPSKQPYSRSSSSRTSPPSGFGALNFRDPSFLDAGADPTDATQPQRSASPTEGDYGVETIRAGDEGHHAYLSSSAPPTMVPVSYHSIYRARQESQRLLSGSGPAARWANNNGPNSDAMLATNNANDSSSMAPQRDVGVQTPFELSRQSPTSGNSERSMVQGGIAGQRPKSAGGRLTKGRAHGATVASEQRRLWASRVGMTSEAMPLGPGHFYRQVQVPEQDAHVVELFGQARKVRATVEGAGASAAALGEEDEQGGGGPATATNANGNSKGRPATAPAAPLLTGGGKKVVKPAHTGWGYFLKLGLKKANNRRRRAAQGSDSGVVNQKEDDKREAAQAVRLRTELAEKWRQLSRDE